MPSRGAVYEVIDLELDYQDRATASDLYPDMIEMSAGDILLAMEHNLSVAREVWYKDAAPYENTAEYIRKVTALGVKFMMQFSATSRK